MASPDGGSKTQGNRQRALLPCAAHRCQSETSTPFETVAVGRNNARVCFSLTRAPVTDRCGDRWPTNPKTSRAPLVAMLIIALSACAPGRGSPPATAAPPPMPDDRAPLEWARDEEMLVVVRRSCRTVTIYHHGDWMRTYSSVSFGREPGPKLYEGDRRTPNG